LSDSTPNINVKIITILGAIAVAVVFFFAIIFAFTASIQATFTRLVTSGIIFIIGVAVIVEPKCKDCPQLQVSVGGCPLELQDKQYVCSQIG
jgi:hypothetical protein